MDNNQQIREDLTKIQSEMQEALNEIIKQVGKKLKTNEKKEIEKEFAELNEVIERIKTGLVWIALFGKTSVGKSAIINSLVGDNVAQTGVAHDLTTKVDSYEKSPWRIVDIPGIMGRKNYEDLALKEAFKAHGHIFVIDGEPFQDELESFDKVYEKSPDTPKIVFVNKWSINSGIPKSDRETIRSRISQKMGKYVKSPEYIIYGDAMRFDKDNDVMVRQDVPKLLDCLYKDSSSLGAIMNILDPAKRATELNKDINHKIFEIRVKLARKVIAGFSLASGFSGAVPFACLIAQPSILSSMVFAICIIMGKKQDMGKALNITKNLMLACAHTIGISFTCAIAGYLLIDIITTTISPVFGIGAILGLGADVAGMGYLSYKRTATLGEVTIEYIRNDFSWGAEGQDQVIKSCQEKVKKHYINLKLKNSDSLATSSLDA